MKNLNASPRVQAETPLAGYQEHFIVKGQVAERIHKTTRTVELWTRKGILPCMKIGRSVLYFWPDVEAQLRERFTLNRPSSDTPKKNGNVTIRKG